MKKHQQYKRMEGSPIRFTPYTFSFLHKRSISILSMIFTTALLTACGGGKTTLTETQSSSIAITSDDEHVLVVNREADTVSIIEVRDDDDDTHELIAELEVGDEPRFIAIQPGDDYAFVSNANDSTVSVITLQKEGEEEEDDSYQVQKTIQVGIEPRGITFTPNGHFALVANHTSGTVSVINTHKLEVIKTITTGGNPTAITISNDGDNQDHDELVYVTRFFAELIDPDRPDGFDDAKQGVIDTFSVADAVHPQRTVDVSQIHLLPLADSGFTNDRRNFCQNTRNSLQASGTTVFFPSGPNGTGDGAARLVNDTFCPDNNSSDDSDEGPIANNQQGVYPNILNAIMLRNQTLYLPNIAVQPEPPVFFENNVQGLVSSIDLETGQDLSVNINAQIKLETPPLEESGSLQRLFASDLVAIAANANGNDFLVVSRGGSFVIRASLNENKRLSIHAPDDVIRFQTGSMPTGIVMSSDGTRAYTNNEINRSVTAINLVDNSVIYQDIHASAPPQPGSQEHRTELGKLAFFTALGIPDTLDNDGDNQYDIRIRDVIPVDFRGKASNSGWSTCASCHEDGRSDNVTWIFPTGPVQTVPMEGTFAKGNINEQRILNWNGVRGSISDFNNNSRGIQGGRGHATNVNGVNRTTEIFNHGLTGGISDALDAMTEWSTTIRALNMPQPTNDFPLVRARQLFEDNCASCHGGVNWTKSSTTPYLNNPTFTENPIGSGFFTAGPAPGQVPSLDLRLTVGGSSIVRIDDPVAGALTFLDDVGTFDPNSVLGIRGSGAIAGQSTQGFAALGATGFNTPSLLGVGYHAPYLHDGNAEDLATVFERHTLPQQDNVLISQKLTPDEQTILIEFLNSIDDTTPLFISDTEKFIQAGS